MQASKAAAVCLAVVFVVYVGYAIYYETSNLGTSANPSQSSAQPKSVEEMVRTITRDRLYDAINSVRVTNNLKPYGRNPDLDKSASMKCADMVKYAYYEHAHPTTAKEGGSYAEDVGVKYRLVSENLNLGYFNNSKDVIDSWMGSKSHKTSILDPKFTEIGFATCVIPKWPDQLAIVQHKIEPAKVQTSSNASNQIQGYAYAAPTPPASDTLPYDPVTTQRSTPAPPQCDYDWLKDVQANRKDLSKKEATIHQQRMKSISDSYPSGYSNTGQYLIAKAQEEQRYNQVISDIEASYQKALKVINCG